MKKNNKQNDGVQRGLKDRHISMIAIGGMYRNWSIHDFWWSYT